MTLEEKDKRKEGIVGDDPPGSFHSRKKRKDIFNASKTRGSLRGGCKRKGKATATRPSTGRLRITGFDGEKTDLDPRKP